VSPPELDILVRGIVDLAIIAAAWSLLFFGRVKLSSPAAPRRTGRAKNTAGASAPDAAADQGGSEQAVTPIGRAA